jgi:hypothetical protein
VFGGLGTAGEHLANQREMTLKWWRGP